VDESKGRFLWELAERKKDGSTVCAHGKVVTLTGTPPQWKHASDKSLCVGTE
jgi:hypothetical protein